MTQDDLKRVDVALKGYGYPVFTGSGFLPQIGELVKPYVHSGKVFVVTDDLVADLYLPSVKESLERSGLTVFDFVVPQGETSKSWEQAGQLLERILETGCDRHSTLLSLGGGVVGDLTGFCASLLLRGVDFIQVPTTLLAQTDSSVGGKTAVNSASGKNLIGTFHQPKAVFIDVHTLKTLEPRQVLAGFAEVAKYGLVLDEGFWNWLIDNGDRVLALDEEACTYAVEQSCRIKAGIVAADEFEQTGLRSLLNYGHTFGHAIEAATGRFGTVLHGEAVATGSVLAAWLSADLGLCAKDVPERIEERFKHWGLPTRFEKLEIQALTACMKKDKKTTGSQLNLVLLKKTGAGFLARDVNLSDIEKVLREKGEKQV